MYIIASAFVGFSYMNEISCESPQYVVISSIHLLYAVLGLNISLCTLFSYILNIKNNIKNIEPHEKEAFVIQ
jgi:hypothetical protein